MLEYLLLLVGLVRTAVRSQSELVAENLLLRQQLAVLTRPTRRRPRLHSRDRLFRALAPHLWRDWRRHLVLVRPETVIRWHRRGWRLFWRWRSRTHVGRPRLNREVRELIATMARDNPRWGSERVRGELLKLGIAVSRRTIQRDRGRCPARPPSQSWRTFLANHAHQLWAADLLVVQTLTFKALYVLILIAHGRRELVHVAVTAHPTAAWLWRQLVEATPWGRRPRCLLRDRDAVYGGACRTKLRALGIEQLLTPGRAPRANAVAERVIGSLRRECTDHVIPLGERQLSAVLAEYVDYYNTARPHRTLQLDAPRPQARPRAGPPQSVRSRSILGGLHHAYETAA
jgi:hypothetical protein